MARAGIRNTVRFLLNDETVELADIRPDETVLDWLRLRRNLRGSKEGCAEGDCGACTVLVGRLCDGNLVYESVNACIRFLATLDGCHLVTIEHLRGYNGRMHPVQQAMVDFHGSQCGFCTPGFVMSLYALWMREPWPTDADVEKALQGNLCRCTGYDAIVKAAKQISTYGVAADCELAAERGRICDALLEIRDGKRVEIGVGKERLVLPANVNDLADMLEDEPNARIVAGATDVGLWVTKFMRDIAPAVFVGHLDKLKTVTLKDGMLTIGAGATYTSAQAALADAIPAFGPLIDRIGGEQVRNMGTIGGNIANGSPIGDMPPPLIALGATLTLRKGKNSRTIALEEFFIAYGKQDRQPGEFVEAVHVPLPPKGPHFAAHKVTKRRDEDITATLGAFLIETDADGSVTSARIAYGGMAATPKRASAVEKSLIGKKWSMETVEAALPAYEKDFTPLSDMRASADYRMLVAKNLLKRFFLETTGTSKPIMVTRERAA